MFSGIVKSRSAFLKLTGIILFIPYNHSNEVQTLLTNSCTIFEYKRKNCTPMFYEKIYKSALFEQFTQQTRRFIKVLLRGEKYPGEYKKCKDTLEMIQKQLLFEEKRSEYNISVSAPPNLVINKYR